jgi:hypothetical protein
LMRLHKIGKSPALNASTILLPNRWISSGIKMSRLVSELELPLFVSIHYEVW